jgi:uncharacterized OsmC-like protein
LVRSTVKKNYLFVVIEIEKILDKMNKKIKRVSIYKNIRGNSTEKFKIIFGEQIYSILKTKNKKPTKEELTYCLNLAKEKHCIVRLELCKEYKTYYKNYYMDIDEYFDIDRWLRVNKYD